VLKITTIQGGEKKLLTKIIIKKVTEKNQRRDLDPYPDPKLDRQNAGSGSGSGSALNRCGTEILLKRRKIRPAHY
jgi:hypothetical protein